MHYYSLLVLRNALLHYCIKCFCYKTLIHDQIVQICCVSIIQAYSTPQISSDMNQHGFCIEVGEYDVGKFPVTYDFREYALYCVYRESAWCRESLQRRKAFEKLLPVSSPPLRCTFVSLSPLTPSFSLSLPVIPGVAYKVMCTSAEQQGCVGSCFLFLFLFLVFLGTSHIYVSILGSPFSTPPHRESPH